MILRNLKISDPKGVFLTSPAVVVDWRRFKYLQNHVDVHELSSKRITLLRLPQFKPSEAAEQGPLLPDIDIDLRKLEIGHVVIERLEERRGGKECVSTYRYRGEPEH